MKAQYSLLSYLKAKKWHTPDLGSKKKDIVRILESHNLVKGKVGGVVSVDEFLIAASKQLCGGGYTKKRKLPKPVGISITKDEPFAKTKKFLDSWEWTTLRYKILMKHGRRCMCCGATPEDGAKICVDHIKPRHTHPELALDECNLQVLCYECNKGKGAWDDTDFR